MKIFNKKETLIQNMTFMAILATINIVISVLSTLVSILIPLLSVFLIIVLPLTSTLVEVYCKDRYFIVYAVASIGLSLVATLWNTQHTIFYLIPSIITGFIFGFLIKRKISGFYSIFISSIVQTGITYLTIPLLNAIYGTNFIDISLEVLNLKESIIATSLLPSLIFIISLIQVGLSYFVVYEEMIKLSIEKTKEIKNTPIYALISLIIALVSVGIGFLNVKISMLLFTIGSYVGFCALYLNIKDNYLSSIIGAGAAIILAIILFAVFYPMLSEPQNITLVTIFLIWINIASIFVNFLNKKKATSKIENTNK